MRAARNLPQVDVLPQQGANVYDILRRDTLVLTRDAVQHPRGAASMSRFRVIPPADDAPDAAADVRHRPRSGDHREGDRPPPKHSQVIFPRAADATKAPGQGGRRRAVQRQCRPRSTRSASRARLKRFRGRPGRRSDYKKAIVTLARGQRDRRDRRGSEPMALKTFNPTTPSRRAARHRRPQRAVEGQAGQVPDRGPARQGRPQQHRPHHDAPARRRQQAALPRSSTSSGASSTCRPRSSGSNTTRTAPPSSR